MRTRAWAATAALSLATVTGGGTALVAMASPASAATPAATSHGPVRTTGLTTSIPCSGDTTTCTLTVTGFKVVNGALQAVGTVSNGTTTAPFTTNVVDPAACQILNLTLGPIHLNLLGLVVDLNQVHLQVTAQPGPGNLLGNLLCAVTNLLNDTGGLGNSLTTLLNQINTILAGL